MHERMAAALVLIAGLAIAGPALGVEISIDDVELAEPDAGSAVMTFTVSLDVSPALGPVLVNYATANGTATAGDDYAAASAVLTFGPSETEQIIEVTIYGDTLVEGDETFTVTLSDPVNATIADGFGEGTIIDYQSLPSVSIAADSEYEGEGLEENYLEFPVTLSAASGHDVTVYCTMADGTANANIDYTAIVNAVVIPAGETVGFASVELIGNSWHQDDRTLFIKISSAINATFTDDEWVTGTILDDDPLPVVAVGDASEYEGDTTFENILSFPVTLSHPYGEDALVICSFYSGTAILGDDFDGLCGVEIESGDTTGSIGVELFGNRVFEHDETFTLLVSGVSYDMAGWAPSDASGIGTILNDDPPPTLAIDDVSVPEGAGTATFTVSKSGDTWVDASVDYDTVAGTAQAGADYTGSSGGLVFQPGLYSQTIEVPVLDDGELELDETFTVVLSGPSDAAIADGVGEGMIMDDEPPPVIDVGDAGALEGGSGDLHEIAFPVTLSIISPREVSVAPMTVAGTAASHIDFNPAVGPVVIPAGEDLGFAYVELVGDDLLESDEIFDLVLGSPVNGTVGDAEATGLIVNDDFVTCSPLPGAVGDLRLAKVSGGAEILLTWSDAPDGDDYLVHRDFAPSGPFIDIVGVAPPGALSLTLPMPPFDQYYLVGGRNSCGFGPFD